MTAPTITLLDAPTISIIARPLFTEPGHLPVNFLGDADDGERLAEFSGRLCYMSQHNPAERTTADYLKHILETGHGSVLEHANYSLLVEGVSRSLTHEWIRHRAGWAYSQLSQRFVDSSNVAFVIPPAMLGQSKLLGRWGEAMAYALDAYNDLVDDLYELYDDWPDKTMRRKKAREAARSVLPNATETKLVMTGNVRSWRFVLGLRGDPIADAEINRLSRVIATLLKDEAPGFFQDVEITDTGVTFAFEKV